MATRYHPRVQTDDLGQRSRAGCIGCPGAPHAPTALTASWAPSAYEGIIMQYRPQMQWVVMGFLLSMLLGGCTTYWYKPGATTQDFNMDKSICLSRAYQSAPVAMTAVPIGVGYNQPVSTNCI